MGGEARGRWANNGSSFSPKRTGGARAGRGAEGQWHAPKDQSLRPWRAVIGGARRSASKTLNLVEHAERVSLVVVGFASWLVVLVFLLAFCQLPAKMPCQTPLSTLISPPPSPPASTNAAPSQSRISLLKYLHDSPRPAPQVFPSSSFFPPTLSQDTP